MTTPLRVERADLYVPELGDLAKLLEGALKMQFAEVVVEVVDAPPDLRAWGGLAARGLGGDRVYLADVGGEPNLFQTSRRDKVFDLKDVAAAVAQAVADSSSCSYVLGAAAASRRVVGRNAELVPCEHLGTGQRSSAYIDVDPDDPGKFRFGAYDSRELGLLANLLVCEGTPGPAVHVQVRQRTSPGKDGVKENFVSCMRKCLAQAVEAGDLAGHVGIGGCFRVVNGRVRAHVMPDFPSCDLCVEDVADWLHFYDMGPGLTCLTYFVSGDPTGGSLNLRQEHTHFFDHETRQGGHFHHSAADEEIEYDAYLVPAHEIVRVENAFKEY